MKIGCVLRLAVLIYFPELEGTYSSLSKVQYQKILAQNPSTSENRKHLMVEYYTE